MAPVEDFFMAPMEDVVFVFTIALIIGVPSFLIFGAILNGVYRLASGKFFGFINLPTAIVFVIYLLILTALCWEVLSRVAVTH